MTIRIEHGDLDRWVATMDRATSKAPEEATRVVAKGALNIKTDARRRIGRPRHAPAYPESIGYDIWQGLRGPVAEIGPDKLRRQGALGNLLEYGSVHNPPHPHMIPAAEAEQPRFERAMEALAERLLEER
ncbi:hypothetical protein [Micromonospora sp. HM5-17]|uniref:hypothetical protein n=1 Tax=Micromonospora sp. HM5-17 TaxID=2487710 RepID=UPI000F4803C1|nr:hypothetical protein [Micromonospora sp. HM5-17]ROT29666.1 hypothetical protein EF879_18655 [Micromonospora sp. HM5-17]